MQSFAVFSDLAAVFRLPVIEFEDWEARAYESTPWAGIVNRAFAGVRDPAHDPGTDQGPGFVKEVDLWACIDGVTLGFSRPGKPTDHACIELLNAGIIYPDPQSWPAVT